MADGIAIWSKKPVQQKKILLDMVLAAYEANIPFNCEGNIAYEFEGQQKIYPNQFTLTKTKGKEVDFMIFHIAYYEKQKYGFGKWENIRLKNQFGEPIIYPILYRITVSEDLEDEMTFNFAYHYLKLNKAHFITIYDFIVDWNLINAVYKFGFKDYWYKQV